MSGDRTRRSSSLTLSSTATKNPTPAPIERDMSESRRLIKQRLIKQRTAFLFLAQFLC